MKIERHLIEPEKTQELKSITPGTVVRFSNDTIQDAIKSDLFWMRIDAPEAKDRVRLVNMADGKQVERDGDHRVVIVPTVLRLNF